MPSLETLPGFESKPKAPACPWCDGLINIEPVNQPPVVLVAQTVAQRAWASGEAGSRISAIVGHPRRSGPAHI